MCYERPRCQQYCVSVASWTNLEEAKLMLDEKHQQKVAEAIAKGICSYLGVKYVLET